jgi:hypothetical protein
MDLRTMNFREWYAAKQRRERIRRLVVDILFWCAFIFLAGAGAWAIATGKLFQ